MGTFSTGITGDDTVADVVGFIADRLKHGADLELASQEALKRFQSLEQDEDERPLLYVALAHAQWKYGAVAPAILKRVQEDVSHGRGLDRWKDNPSLLRQRERVLAAFVAKVAHPNPMPSARPASVHRLAPFSAGDCLSIATRDGRYTAALVLAADNSNKEFGKNLIAGLDYLDASPPSFVVFERREWLFKRHGNWDGEPDLAWYMPVRFRSERKRFAVIGKVALRSTDLKATGVHSSWPSLGAQILICRAWNRGVVV